MGVLAPGDEHDLQAMLEFAIQHDSPCAIRYPKATTKRLEGKRTPLELGVSEIFHWGLDGTIISCGALLPACMAAAELLEKEDLDVGVINARFVKPLDTKTICRAARETGFLVTVEEAALAGGFGSAVLEELTEPHIESCPLQRLGIPDRFIEHGERGELLADLGLDATGIAQVCRTLAIDQTKLYK